MGRRNGQIHFHQLKPSLQDTIQPSLAVHERFVNLCGSWLRVRGEQIPIPKSLDGDILLWRKMSVRHKQGDFRNSEAELKALRTVAGWTLEMNCVLRNQPIKRIDWDTGGVTQDGEVD